jgi:hypothetical protein
MAMYREMGMILSKPRLKRLTAYAPGGRARLGANSARRSAMTTASCAAETRTCLIMRVRR